MDKVKEMNLLMDIVTRANKLNLLQGDKLSFIMDLDYANQDCPIDLEGLLNAERADFAHDITGIQQNMNRATKKLNNCFVPRFSK